MARFRFLGAHDPDSQGGTGCQEAAGGYLAVGFTTLHPVAPGDIFEVPDVKGNDGTSDADAYRACPARYEELPDTGPSPASGAAPTTSFIPPPPPPPAPAPEEQP